jgi:hypothetical protein
MTVHAIIHMVPLDAKRQPLCKPILAGSIPRDGAPHRVAISLEKTTIKTFPHYVFVYADGNTKRGGVFECDTAAPEKLRALEHLTLYQMLAVNPPSALRTFLNGNFCFLS